MRSELGGSFVIEHNWNEDFES